MLYQLNAIPGIVPEIVVEEVKPGLLSRTIDLVTSVYQLLYHALVPPVEELQTVSTPAAVEAAVEAAVAPVIQSTVATQVAAVVTDAAVVAAVDAAPTIQVIERIVATDCSGHKAELDTIKSHYESILQSMATLQSSVAALTPALTGMAKCV